jgi:hypothetical protein
MFLSIILNCYFTDLYMDAETLNIFPSQPMHAGEPSPKGSSSMAAINSAPSNNALAIAAGSSKRPPAAAAAGGQPSRLNNPADQPSASGKDGKAAVVKVT